MHPQLTISIGDPGDLGMQPDHPLNCPVAPKGEVRFIVADATPGNEPTVTWLNADPFDEGDFQIPVGGVRQSVVSRPSYQRFHFRVDFPGAQPQFFTLQLTEHGGAETVEFVLHPFSTASLGVFRRHFPLEVVFENHRFSNFPLELSMAGAVFDLQANTGRTALTVQPPPATDEEPVLTIRRGGDPTLALEHGGILQIDIFEGRG